MNETKWSKNVILADADYIDRVAFNLIVNFERMLGRRIPQADMSKWAECIALDGGLRAGSHETQVVLIHSHQKARMDNFSPSDYDRELNGKAFTGNLGEFVFSAVSTEGLAGQDDLFLDTLQLVATASEVERLMVVPTEHIYNKVSDVLRRADDGSRPVTVFAMQPMPGGSFRQEILGYSLMAALGIRSDEINPNQ